MDKQGAWKLFLATGLPQAYLVAKGLETPSVPSGGKEAPRPAPPNPPIISDGPRFH